MADIELIIRISEEDYESIKDDVKKFLSMPSHKVPVLYEAVNKGTVLPKGHGKLKDTDKIINDGRSKGFCDWYDEIKYADTIIEADKDIEEKDQDYDDI